MLTGGTRVFLQRPADFAERRLDPAAILSISDDLIVVQLESPLELAVDDELHFYYEADRKFVQQPIRITRIGPGEDEAVDGKAVDDEAIEDETDDDKAVDDKAGNGNAIAEDAEDELRIQFVTTGPFISAEAREAYRVVTMTSDLTAALGEEMHCALADVSVTGFSVIADASHEIGTVLPAALRYEDKQFTGAARIQSIKKLITGKIRYGLHSIEGRESSSDLIVGQQLIGAEIQRKQLSRRSRNG